MECPADQWCPQEGKEGCSAQPGSQLFSQRPHTALAEGSGVGANRKGDLLFEAGLLAWPHCRLGQDSQIAKYLEIHELTPTLPSALRRKELQILENFIKGMLQIFYK